MFSKATKLTLTLAIALYTTHEISGYKTNLSKLPNGGDSKVASWLDHTSLPVKPKFHTDFPGSWTKEFCLMDSDGDGISNGIELGDPCCTNNPVANAELSNPADGKSKTSNAATCGSKSTSTPSTTSTPAITSSTPPTSDAHTTNNNGTSGPPIRSAC